MSETPNEPAAAPAAGWYQDPHGAGLRWWDGSAWTEHVHAEAPAAPSSNGGSPDPDALLAMYSVRHEAGASGEPSYKGYKAMLVLLALAILAIVVGLLLVGGGDDDGGSLGSDPGDVTVSYSGAETNDLHRIEPTLDGAPITIQVRPEFYALAEPLRRS